MCPGKRALIGQHPSTPSAASMRPGHCAPERAEGGCGRADGRLPASMRPGHCAPERAGHGVPDGAGIGASMRPGHCAPERGPRTRSSLRASPCFNEAGALCPGKRRCGGLRGRGTRTGFNEAGALCPGKRPTSWASRFDWSRGFNEAGALCPGKSCRQAEMDEILAQLQ